MHTQKNASLIVCCQSQNVQCINFEGLDKGSFPTRVVPQAEAADYSRCPFPYAERNFESRGLASSVSGANH